MAFYGWDCLIAKPIVLAGKVTSQPFTVPRSAGTMTVITPLQSEAGDWKLQSLSPIGSDVTEVWNDIYHMAEDNTLTQLTFDFSAGMAVVIPNGQFGAGVLRIHQYGDPQVADATWIVLFSTL